MKKGTKWYVIKVARIANDVRISYVAKISGVSEGYINMLERGIKNNPSYDIIEKIAQSLNLTASQLSRLAHYYDNLNCDDKRKYQLTLMKTLEIIKSNLDKDEN